MQKAILVDPDVLGIIRVQFAASIAIFLSCLPIVSTEVDDFRMRGRARNLDDRHYRASHGRKSLHFIDGRKGRAHDERGVSISKVDEATPRQIGFDFRKRARTGRLQPPETATVSV